MKDIILFLTGVWVGIFLLIIISDTQIKSKKLIRPTMVITNDGVKTDTLYIYKKQ